MNYDYSKRGFLLPKGCKDLGDILKLESPEENNIPKPLRTNEEIREVFSKYVPEIAAGKVEIVSLARKVGRRCLLVVRSLDPKISAVQACSFKRWEGLYELVMELGGEFPTIVQWQPSPEDLIRSAFLGEKVDLDSSSRQAVVTIDSSRLNPVMFGGKDQIARMNSELVGLVSEVTGWKVRLARAEIG